MNDKHSSDYYFTGNRSVKELYEIKMAANIANLEIAIFPPLNSTTDKHFCLAVNNNQVIEYEIFKKALKLIREEWEKEMLKLGAPRSSQWYWRVMCPIGEEKDFFENYEFPEDVSNFLLNCPKHIDINLDKISKIVSSIKLDFITICDKEKINDNKKSYEKKDESFILNENCNELNAISISDICDGFDLEEF